MKVEVSIGEAIDKLSILDIKLEKIKDESKKIEIQKEIDALEECHQYKKYGFYYELLIFVNEQIWNMTDIIKSISVDDPNFSKISNQIFEFNQKRFRIKNWYNLITNSNIKEQKSYALSQCKIIIEDMNTFYNKIPEIHFLSLEYDQITIVSPFNETINTIIQIPTLYYSDKDETIKNVYYLKDIELDSSTRNYFQTKPIVYISGGLLGDFVHQLSVINEIFLKTGRKGILYIANDIGGENFSFGLSKTYEDTYKLITSQNYIHSYKIYHNEPYDINLSSWRKSNVEIGWDKIFFNNYRISWGVHPWINVPYEDQWKDTVFVSTTSYRNPYNINYSQLFKEYGPSIKFIDLSDKETTLFKNSNKIDTLNLYKPKDIYELCIAIKSCKLFIGNYSSPLAFAYGMHKKSVVCMFHVDDIRHIGLEKIIPNIIINSDINVISEKIKLLCQE
jgi:hypothetical protein